MTVIALSIIFYPFTACIAVAVWHIGQLAAYCWGVNDARN